MQASDINDPLELCPYDPSHQIRRSRIQYHLVKCKKNFPNAEVEVCPFDATHIIPSPEYRYHLKVCPNRRIVEQQLYRVDTERVTGNIDQAPFEPAVLPPAEENWDDCSYAGYNPSERNGPLPVFKPPEQGATRSQRKAFRAEHRRKVQELDSISSRPSSSASTSSVLSTREPPRLPKTRSQALQAVQKVGRGRGSPVSVDDAEVVASLGGLSLGVPLGRGKSWLSEK